MKIEPYKPAVATLSLWRNAPVETQFALVDDDGNPVDLSGVTVGLTMTGLEGGASLALRTDAPDEILKITDATAGIVTLTVGAAMAESVLVGQRGQWRLWLAVDGGEVPLIYGPVEGRDSA